MEKLASYLNDAYAYGQQRAREDIEKMAREGQDMTTAQNVSTGLAGIPGLGVLGAPIAAPEGTGFGSFGATGLGQAVGLTVGGGIGAFSGLRAAGKGLAEAGGSAGLDMIRQGTPEELEELASKLKPDAAMKGLRSLVRRPVVGGLMGMAAGGAGMNYLHQRQQRDTGNV